MALSRTQKEQSVAELTKKIQSAQNIIIWEYHGLDSETIGLFRSDILEKKGLNKVYKNRLAKIAFKAAGKEEVINALTGPNSFLFTDEEDEGSMKVLADLVKDNNEAISFKGGYIDGEYHNAESIQEIASLPGREDLLSMLLSVLQAPMRNLAYSLSLVAEQESQKNEETPAVEETTETTTSE